MRRYFITAVACTAIVTAGCRGKQSVASKSAEAYREAIAQGRPVSSGGHMHGGHPSALPESATTGQDMSAMDHSGMPAMQHETMSGMGQSQMPRGSMAGMTNMPGMHDAMSGKDHSKMQKGSMAGMSNMPGMQHKNEHDMNNMPGMHETSAEMSSMPGMQHGEMQHGAMQNMTGMEHGMAGMERGSPVSVVIAAPSTSSSIAQLSPTATLQEDTLDKPAPVAVEESQKATGQGGQNMLMTPAPQPPAQPSPQHQHQLTPKPPEEKQWL